MTDPLPPLRQVIADHNLAASKALGQHFLFDLNLTGRIARAAGPLHEGTVIEVGPGPGGLTRALLAAGAQRLVVIEKDRRCLPLLAEIAAAYPGRLEIIEGNAVDQDMSQLGAPPRRVVANLPYNVSTVLLLGWLRQSAHFHSFTLMFQAEVADRLVAQPGRKAYGRLSVMCQWLCQVERVFNVDRRAFTPPPKVASSVVSLRPRPAPLGEASFSAMEHVVALAFGQRRKMLRAALRALPDAEALLAAAGIPGTERAEQVPIERFAALARAYAERP